jgi:hypothetical protein
LPSAILPGRSGNKLARLLLGRTPAQGINKRAQLPSVLQQDLAIKVLRRLPLVPARVHRIKAHTQSLSAIRLGKPGKALHPLPSVPARVQ